MFIAVVALFVTLFAVVGIHEAGHAITAHWVGVKIKSINIGFGKAVFFYKDKSARDWFLRLWPLGGYVQLLNSRIEPVNPRDYPQSFDKKPIWARCFILVSGALANFFFAWLLLTLIVMIGHNQQLPIVQAPPTQTIAATAGLRANDRIIAINGWATGSWQEVGMGLITGLGKKQIDFWVENKGNERRQLTFDLSRWRNDQSKQSLLTSFGIIPAPLSFSAQYQPGKSFKVSAYQGIVQFKDLVIFFLILMKQLISGVIPFSVLLGPIGLFASSIQAFAEGLVIFLSFLANLSLVVGLVNLFPIPGLDGCSIIYTLIEKIRGKPISVATEILFYRFATIGFSLLFIQLVLNDLARYFKFLRY